LGGGGFYGEPAAIFVFVGPDAAHFGASVAGDQSKALLRSAGKVWRYLHFTAFAVKLSGRSW
jgi:hypothetical protein